MCVTVTVRVCLRQPSHRRQKAGGSAKRAPRKGQLLLVERVSLEGSHTRFFGHKSSWQQLTKSHTRTHT